jgi:uncharacterized protein (TIGR02145 family)
MKIILNLTVLMIIVLITSACSDKTPDIVVIGTQTWTTKNLDVATFRNGDAIPEAKTEEEWKAAGDNKRPVWCYYGNDATNGTRYGKLYNWYAVNDARGLAPTGWHIPTDLEWTVLSTFLGGNEAAGKKMKSSSGWSDNGNGNNSSGFSGLPGGCRFGNGYFMHNGCGILWSASETDETNAGDRVLFGTISDLGPGYGNKGNGHSVRCVKN